MSNNVGEHNIQYSDLEKLFGIKYIKKVENESINNIVSTSVFIPDNLKYVDKMGMYFSGLVKIVETFNDRKPNETFKLRIYVDEIIFNLKKLFRHHRIKLKSLIRQTNTKQNITTQKKHNPKQNTFYTKKRTTQNNNIAHFGNNIQNYLSKGVITYYNSTQYKELNKNYKALHRLLNAYKIYLDIIKENLDNNYYNIEIVSFNCKDITKLNEGIKYGHPTTFGSVIRLLPFFEPGVDVVILNNVSHAITPLMKEAAKNVISSDEHSMIALNMNDGYLFSNPKDIARFPYIISMHDIYNYDNKGINILDYFFKNNINSLLSFKDNIHYSKLNNNDFSKKKGEFLDFIENDIPLELLKIRNLAGFYLIKTHLSKHFIDIFYNIIKESIEQNNKRHTDDNKNKNSLGLLSLNMDIFGYGYDEYVLLAMNILFVLSDLKIKFFNGQLDNDIKNYFIEKEETHRTLYKTEIIKKTFIKDKYFYNTLPSEESYIKYELFIGHEIPGQYIIKRNYMNTYYYYSNLSKIFLNNPELTLDKFNEIHEQLDNYFELLLLNLKQIKKAGSNNQNVNQNQSNSLSDIYSNLDELFKDDFEIINNLNVCEYVKLYDYINFIYSVVIDKIPKNIIDKKNINNNSSLLDNTNYIYIKFISILKKIMLIYVKYFWSNTKNYSELNIINLYHYFSIIFKKSYNRTDNFHVHRFNNLNRLLFSDKLNNDDDVNKFDKIGIIPDDLLFKNVFTLIYILRNYFYKTSLIDYLNTEDELQFVIATLYNSYDEYIPYYVGFNELVKYSSLDNFKVNIEILNTNNFINKTIINRLAHYYKTYTIKL